MNALTVDTAFVIWSFAARAWLKPGGVECTTEIMFAGVYSAAECDTLARDGSMNARSELREILAGYPSLNREHTVFALLRAEKTL